MEAQESVGAQMRERNWWDNYKKRAIRGEFRRRLRRRCASEPVQQRGRRGRPLSLVPEGEEEDIIMQRQTPAEGCHYGDVDAYHSDDDAASDITSTSFLSIASAPPLGSKYATLPPGIRISEYSMNPVNTVNSYEKISNQADSQDGVSPAGFGNLTNPTKRATRAGRRHTVGGPHGITENDHKEAFKQAMAGHKSAALSNDAGQPCSGGECNTLSRRDAKRKREAFLRYLQKVYPQHADAIAGRSKQDSENHVRSLTRASASSSEVSYSVDQFGPVFEQDHQFVRGAGLRASLPIIRCGSRRLDRPGVVYLQYEGETRAAELPSELTSLDTIRALFVQSYPGLLTMPVLDKQRHSLLLKNTKTGKFDEIDNVKKIKDRSFIRARPREGGTGIPMPGAKKGPAKASENSDNKINNRTGLLQNTNQNNNGTKAEGKTKKKAGNYNAKAGFGLKNPTRSFITSPERSSASPRTSTPISKPNGNLSSFGFGGKAKEANKPVSTPPTQSPKSARDANNNTSMDDAAQLHSSGSPPPDNQGPLPSPTGNGLGGGSVSKTGFSYHHGKGVMSYRKTESPSDSLKSSGKDGSLSASVEGGLSDKASPPGGSTQQKNKLQPLGAPLKGDIRKAPPNVAGKRSIPTPKGKIYGSLIPSSKMKNASPGNMSAAPTSGSVGSLASETNPSKMPSPSQGLKAPKASVQSKIALGGRMTSNAPPPIAPKPTASRLALHTPSNSFRGKTTEIDSARSEPAREDTSIDALVMDDEFRPELAAFSNIKRPESPEPRATINGRGGSRSLRPKHSPKPVSIPQVPHLESIRRQLSDEVSKSNIDIRQTEATSVPVHPQPNLAKEASQSAPDLVPAAIWPSPDEACLQRQTVDPWDGISAPASYASLPLQKDADKDVSNDESSSKVSSENSTSLKRSLSSLKRFIPGRSSTKQSKSHSKASVEDLTPKTEVEGPIHVVQPEVCVAETAKTEDQRSDKKPDAPREDVTNAPSSVQAIASKFESADQASNPTHLHYHPNLKTPTIPTTDLVSTLVKNGSDASREAGNGRMANSQSAQSVGDEINQRLNPGNLVRKSNLVKSGSYNSVNSSDSATSNNTNSSVSQQRPHSTQKKVSFQDDVMVSDGIGTNTYVQRLNAEGENTFQTPVPVLKSRASAAEQLGIVATEADIKQFLDNRALSPPADAPLQGNNRIMSPVPQSASVAERKSAVEAAIETITGKPSSRKVTINDSYRAATQRPLTPSFQMASHMAEIASGVVVEDGSAYHNYGYPPNQSYKEMWYPPYGTATSPTAYDQYPQPMRAMTPNPACYDPYPSGVVAVGRPTTVSYPSTTENHPVKLPENNRSVHVANAQPDPYFQTQSGLPHGKEAPDENRWSVDTPPYYEGCGSWRRGQSVNMRVDPQQQQQQKIPTDHGSAKHSGVKDGGGDEVALRQDARAGPPPPENATRDRVKMMEQQIANLTGMVETMITHTDKEVAPAPANKDAKRMPAQSRPQEPGASSSDNDVAITTAEVRKQMLKLRETAQDLKKQLDDIKRQQRTNLERMSDMLVTRGRELTSLIATTAGSEYAPVRARRLTLDRERSSYGDSASRTEKQLTDVEAAVEELRNEVVERRCRVNTREVEALALQLSQAGRTIANLKSSFPSLCDEMRTVGSAETEVIIQEEKFMDTEPGRLDEQLKRCKQLTQTLFTLKKLATVQEARSKTPVNVLAGQGMMGARPETPSQYLASLMSYGSPSRGAHRGPSEADELKHVKNRILNDVRSMRVDSTRRMQSLQDAEQRWTRRVKYIRQYDSRKMEKALELAEKALRKTNNISAIEERRKNHFASMFGAGGAKPRGEAKLSASLSESSSVDSLSPPPPPMTNMTSAPPQPEVPPYASSTCSMSTASSAAPAPPSNLASPDGGYISSEILSPQHQKTSSYGSSASYEQPYSHQMSQQGSFAPQAQPDPRVAALKHYQFRSNSLQRTRSQRVQQVQHYEEYQRQRSRTPNPFSPSAQYDPDYVVQQYEYEQQYSYQQQAYQDPYTQRGAYYRSPGEYQAPPPPIAEGQYAPQGSYSQYTPPMQVQPQHSYQAVPENSDVQAAQVKYPQRQLRKPTNFSSKLPSAVGAHKDPAQSHRPSPPSSAIGAPGDPARRRPSAKQPSSQMQRKQKMFLGNKPPKPMPVRGQVMATPTINPSAKSSDV